VDRAADLAPASISEVVLKPASAESSITQRESCLTGLPLEGEPKPRLNQVSKRQPLLSGHVSRLAEQWVRDLDGRLHMGTHII
jgi:hypothetical protein